MLLRVILSSACPASHHYVEEGKSWRHLVASVAASSAVAALGQSWYDFAAADVLSVSPPMHVTDQQLLLWSTNSSPALGTISCIKKTNSNQYENIFTYTIPQLFSTALWHQPNSTMFYCFPLLLLAWFWLHLLLGFAQSCGCSSNSDNCNNTKRNKKYRFKNTKTKPSKWLTVLLWI